MQNSAVSDAVDLTRSNNLLTATVDNGESVTEGWYVVYPSFNTYVDNNTTKIYDWNLTLRPQTDAGNYDITSFINYNGNLVHGVANGIFYVNNIKAKNLFSFNITDMSFSVSPSFTRTIKGAPSGDKYYATFSCPYAVAIPSGITPFYAASSANNKVTMNKIANGIPANTGVFLELESNGTSGTGVEYTFTPAASTGSVDGNLLVAGTTDGVAAPVADKTTTTTNYVLAMQSGNVGFYRVASAITSNYTGKAYLQIVTNNSTQTAPMFSFDFGEGTTGINEARNQMEEAREGIFDLQGRRVENPTKGLF